MKKTTTEIITIKEEFASFNIMKLEIQHNGKNIQRYDDAKFSFLIENEGCTLNCFTPSKNEILIEIEGLTERSTFLACLLTIVEELKTLVNKEEIKMIMK